MQPEENNTKDIIMTAVSNHVNNQTKYKQTQSKQKTRD